MLGQWFDEQVTADLNAIRQFAAGRRTEGFLPPDDDGRYAAAVMALRREDEKINQLASRVAHLLEVPSTLREDPAVAARVDEALAGELSFPEGHGPLPRQQVEALVTGR